MALWQELLVGVPQCCPADHKVKPRTTLCSTMSDKSADSDPARAYHKHGAIAKNEKEPFTEKFMRKFKRDPFIPIGSRRPS